MKYLLPSLLLLLLPCAGLRAQTIMGENPTGSGDILAPNASPSPSPEPAEKKGAAAQAPQGPTNIDAPSMDYDGKTGIAIFTGENYGVLVVSPTFTIYCDKLTAYMRKTGTATTPGAKGSPGPKPTASPPGNASASPSASPASGGLKRAIAEGTLIHPAVVVQDKPATNGEDAQHNVGIGQKADYNADTGDIVLTGWPRVSQGINTQIATSAGTVMTMNRDGRTLKTRGPSRTVIQEVTQPAKTGTNAASASPSPTP